MPRADVDPAEFRQLCGHFATGVVVITAASLTGDPAGMTANSFASVSLLPPLISINVDHAADMHAIIGKAKQFAINILGTGQEALSRRFAGNSSGRFEESATGPRTIACSTGCSRGHRELTPRSGRDHSIYVGGGRGASPGPAALLLSRRVVTAGLS